MVPAGGVWGGTVDEADPVRCTLATAAREHKGTLPYVPIVTTFEKLRADTTSASMCGQRLTTEPEETWKYGGRYPPTCV